MPSTDIDGRVIVILSAEEAEMVYRDLRYVWDSVHRLNDTERRIARKIARDLALKPEERFDDSTQPT